MVDWPFVGESTTSSSAAAATTDDAAEVQGRGHENGRQRRPSWLDAAPGDWGWAND